MIGHTNKQANRDYNLIYISIIPEMVRLRSWIPSPATSGLCVPTVDSAIFKFNSSENVKKYEIKLTGLDFHRKKFTNNNFC